jgi:hypothetical protein
VVIEAPAPGWSGRNCTGGGADCRWSAARRGGGPRFKGPDFWVLIKQDLELLERILEAQTTRRVDLQRIIDGRIDDLIHASERSRSLREVASAYKGNWRDAVVVLCIVLFGVIWWCVPHSRTNWLPMFIVLILLALLTTGYALRGLIRSVGAMRRHEPHHG